MRGRDAPRLQFAVVDDARLRRRRLTFILVPIVGLVIAANVGVALSPTLAVDHPLLLIALSSTNRHLALVSNELDALSYYSVGFARLLLSDPLFYLLGYWYGEAALSWMDRKTGRTGEFIRKVERLFGKAAYVLVFAAPNNYICLFAGAARMPPPAFFAVNAAGTLVRLFLIRRVGEAFESPIDRFLDFLRDYQMPLTIATIALVVVQVVLDRQRGTSELEGIRQLEDEIEDEIERTERTGETEHLRRIEGVADGAGDEPAPPGNGAGGQA